MKFRLAAFTALLLVATPALAERLLFDHRLSPPLVAVLAAKDPAMINYNDKNPRYVTDLIVVRGRSASNWTEALLIVARTPDRKVRIATDWLAELRAEAAKRCASEIKVLAEEANSLLIERHSTGCKGDYPPIAMYRVVAGPRSLFMLAVLSREELTDESRRQWRALLESARIE
jgi:hypothetical protein